MTESVQTVQQNQNVDECTIYSPKGPWKTVISYSIVFNNKTEYQEALT